MSEAMKSDIDAAHDDPKHFDRLSGVAEGVATAEEQAIVLAHVARCARCKDSLQSMQVARAARETLTPEEAAAEDAEAEALLRKHGLWAEAGEEDEKAAGAPKLRVVAGGGPEAEEAEGAARAGAEAGTAAGARTEPRPEEGPSWRGRRRFFKGFRLVPSLASGAVGAAAALAAMLAVRGPVPIPAHPGPDHGGDVVATGGTHGETHGEDHGALASAGPSPLDQLPPKERARIEALATPHAQAIYLEREELLAELRAAGYSEWPARVLVEQLLPAPTLAVPTPPTWPKQFLPPGYVPGK